MILGGEVNNQRAVEYGTSSKWVVRSITRDQDVGGRLAQRRKGKEIDCGVLKRSERFYDIWEKVELSKRMYCVGS